MKNIDLQKIKSILPSVPGILQKEEKYFNAAVLIPFVKINSEYHLLFEKRAADIRQGSEICFPGGEFDKEDSNYEQTAIRETYEELGINGSKINIIGQLDTLVGPMGVTVDSFMAEIDISSLSELKIDAVEVEKAFTVPLSFFIDNEPEIYHLRLEIHPTITEKDGTVTEIFPAKSLNLPERYWLPWKMPRREVYVYKTPEGVIWGLTAELIREMILKIKLIL